MKNECDYMIQLMLPPGVESASAVGDKFLRSLSALSLIDPVFSNWLLWDAVEKTSVPLDQACKAITAFVEKNVVRDEDDEPLPEDGFHLFASNFEYGNSRTMGLSVTAGGGQYLNQATLKAGSYKTPPDASIVTYPIFKRSLLALISIWPCPWARVLVTHPDGQWISQSIGGFNSVYQQQRLMTWMGYLSAERAEGLDAPSDLLTEQTPDGGLLMIATEERVDPTNTDQMKRCGALAAIMDDRKRVPWLGPNAPSMWG